MTWNSQDPRIKVPQERVPERKRDDQLHTMIDDGRNGPLRRTLGLTENGQPIESKEN